MFRRVRAGPRRGADAARVESAAGLDALPDEQLAARLDAPYYLGFAEYFCEHYDDAARHFRRGIAVSRAAGQGQFVVQMMVGLAQALESLGGLREASNTAEAAVEAARLAATRRSLGFALVAEAWTAAELGDVEHARVAAEEAVALLDGLDQSVLTRDPRPHRRHVARDRRAGALHRAAPRRGLPDFPLIEPGRRGWLYAVLARRELERGDRGPLPNGSRAARRRCEAWGFRSPKRGRSMRARSSRSPTATPRAAALASRAAERADAVRARVPAARCRTLAGVALARAGDRDAGDPRAPCARSAQLAACEASRYRDEAARELRRLGRRVTGRQRRVAPGQGLAALTG